MAKRGKRDLPDALFCDASYLIAFFVKSDSAHGKAMKIREQIGDRPVRLLTTWPVILEASTLLLYHYGYSQATALLQALRAFEMIEPEEREYIEAIALFKEWNRDQKLSLNDLLHYVILRGRLKNTPVLTFDRDFSKMGLTVFR